MNRSNSDLPKKSAGDRVAAQQSDLALSLTSMLANKRFPGRTSLMVPEVAKALEIDEKHLITLILEGLIGGIEITGRGNKSSREHWRIPVACFDDYILRRSNDTTEEKR